MDDLGAEVREFHRLVVRQLIDDLGIRHQPRVRRQHPVDIRPDDDLGGMQQRAEDGAREITAVAAEGGLHPGRGGRHETGDDETTLKVRRDPRGEIDFALRPLHGGTQRAPLHNDDLACVNPTHLAPDACALTQKWGEQAGRPQFPITRNHVAHGAGGVMDEAHRLQQAGNVTAVRLEPGHEVVTRRLRLEQFVREPDVTRLQGLEGGHAVAGCGFGRGYQPEQCVRNAAAGRQHDRFTRVCG